MKSFFNHRMVQGILLGIVCLYAIIAWHTHGVIERTEERLAAMYEEAEEHDGQIQQRTAYRLETNRYERAQTRPQSFWMPWVFDFNDFSDD